MSEIRNVITEDWSGHSHGEVEDALKGKLSEMEQSIEEAAQAGYAPPDSGIPKTDLAQSVQTSLDKADSAVQDSRYVHTDNNYTDFEKAKLSGLQNYDDTALADRVSQLENAGYITEDDLPEGATFDDALSDTSENGVQNKVVKAAIDSLQNSLNVLIGSGNVQGAIDTFNEITAFLNGINTSDPTLFNQLKSLSDAITTLQNTLSSKANASEVAATYATKSEVTQGLNAKQNTLQFDNEPTENSVKMVNSGAVYEALMTLLGNITIDSNGNWKIGNVPTNYSAKGVQGETVLVTGDPVTLVGMLVNDLYTASAEKGTSAGVAVIIRNNVDILQAKVDALIDALAPLAFIGQKVAKAGLLDWSGNNVFFVTVGYDLKGVTATDNTDEDSHLVVGGNLQVALAANEYYSLIGSTIEVKDDKNNSVSYTLNGNTLTINNLTRSVTIKVVGVLSGAHLVTIPAVEHLTFKDENDNVVSGELIVPDGDPMELTLVPDELWGIESCAVEMGVSEVANAYSWEFDENWNRVHSINIAAVTGDVDIAVVMEDWNTFYRNVNALSGGRTLWNYYPSFMSPLFPLSTANNLLRTTFDEARGNNGYPHTLSMYDTRFCSSIRYTIYNTVNPRFGSDAYVVGNYGRISFNTVAKYNLLKCEDITESRTLFDGSTFNDPVFVQGVKYISRFLPKIITPNGFKQTAIQDTAGDDNGYGSSLWAYRSKAWSEDTSACSFIFNLPKVANLTVYCGSNGGKLYTHDGSTVYTRSDHQVSGVQQLASVNTAHTKAILLCNGSSSGTTAEKIAAAADALNNAYVKYGDKYVWWGKGVTVAQADIWEGAKVYGLPDFVEDVWTQNNG